MSEYQDGDAFRRMFAESLPGRRVKLYVRVGSNDPDGSCGGMVSRRNLKDKGSSARSMEVSTIPRQVDLRLHDDVALDEIELYAEVLSAVAASDGPLSSSELDAALGVCPACG
jgi:hypothetical protein